MKCQVTLVHSDRMLHDQVKLMSWCYEVLTDIFIHSDFMEG